MKKQLIFILSLVALCSSALFAAKKEWKEMMQKVKQNKTECAKRIKYSLLKVIKIGKERERLHERLKRLSESGKRDNESDVWFNFVRNCLREKMECLKKEGYKFFQLMDDCENNRKISPEEGDFFRETFRSSIYLTTPPGDEISSEDAIKLLLGETDQD